MTHEIQAEYSVIGALIIDNDAIDRINDLDPSHFYNSDNRAIFSEIRNQITAGKRVDVITIFEQLKDQVSDCLVLLNQISQSVGSSANISRYAEIITDKAIKRALVALGREIEDVVATGQKSGVCVDLVASKVDALGQRKTAQEPQRLDDMLMNYTQVLEDRMSGKIKPIATGFADLDKKLGGGVDRGSLIVVAGRPAMGKTAFGLGIARNVSYWGSALFLSMEMAKEQVIDRNISAIGKLPLAWLRAPVDNTPTEHGYWDNVTKAYSEVERLNLFIDDQPGLNMLAVRNKARQIKRKNGLDVMVIDQLSFLTGAQSDQNWQAIGEYTRALLQIGKELNIAVVLLAQLNRDCEKRPNKRPQMSDLAQSGSIEQDAATIIFLYRDEVYNPDSQDKGICETIIGKQRQGETGMVGLAYIGDQTRFADLQHGWQASQPQSYTKRSSLSDDL
jgi:replicative DNA helicase